MRNPGASEQEGPGKILTLSLVLAGLALGACGAERKVWPSVAVPNAESMSRESAVVGGMLNEKIMTVSGTVQQIDSDTRQVTLLGPGGTKFKVALAPDMDDAEGFEQGDQVDVTYRESIAFQVKRPDQAKPGVAHTTDVTPALRGENLGGSVTDTVNFRAAIAAIDKADRPRPARGHHGGEDT